MAYFEYKGRNAKGEQVQGNIDAAARADVANILMEKNIIPIEIKETKKSGDKKSWTKIELTKPKPRKEELSQFCRQLLSMYRSGISLSVAIARLAQMAKNTLLREALETVGRDLEGGTSFSRSLQKHPKIFKAIFCNIVQVGEETGRLDQALEQLASFLELEDTTAKRIKSVMRYPMIVVIAIIIAFVIINIVVIPAFGKFFSKYGAELPWATQLLLNTSNFVLAYWPFLLAGFVAAIVTFLFWKSTKAGHYKWDKFMMNSPIFGKIITKILFARFARTFSMVIRTGLALPKGLELVSAAANNDVMSEKILEMRENITRGESLLNTATRINIFSPMVLQMISVGEESGNLDKMLEYVADFYEEEVEYDLKRLKDAIEPVLLIFIGIMVLVLALGVFLPMWNMSRVIR